MRAVRLFLFQTVVILSVTLIFFGVADFALGAFRNGTSVGIWHPYYHHALRPMYVADNRWGDLHTAYATNSLGFRDVTARAVPLQSGQKRLLLLGDSFTEGVGVPYAQSFAGRLGADLASRNIEVLNAGVSSYSPKLYFLKLQYLLDHEHLQIDSLMVFIDISDIQDEVEYARFSPGFHTPLIRKIDIFLRRWSYIYHRHYTFFHHVGHDVLTWVRAGWRRESREQAAATVQTQNDFYANFYENRGRWQHDEKIFEAWGRQGLQSAEDYMRRLAALCRERKIPLAIAVYPWPLDIQKGSLRNRQVTAWERFSAQEKIPFLNLFPEFVRPGQSEQVLREQYIERDVHWNARGHETVAQAIKRSRVLDKLF